MEGGAISLPDSPHRVDPVIPCIRNYEHRRSPLRFGMCTLDSPSTDWISFSPRFRYVRTGKQMCLISCTAVVLLLFPALGITYKCSVFSLSTLLSLGTRFPFPISMHRLLRHNKLTYSHLFLLLLYHILLFIYIMHILWIHYSESSACGVRINIYNMREFMELYFCVKLFYQGILPIEKVCL